mmetsp:Transcript_2669/g.6019  ORF Transcript_2669/g.6019 Transcript_2669/m.6019 type:complete len:268 (+) Transcript_2669:643-1446(+)
MLDRAGAEYVGLVPLLPLRSCQVQKGGNRGVVCLIILGITLRERSIAVEEVGDGPVHPPTDVLHVRLHLHLLNEHVKHCPELLDEHPKSIHPACHRLLDDLNYIVKVAVRNTVEQSDQPALQDLPDGGHGPPHGPRGVRQLLGGPSQHALVGHRPRCRRLLRALVSTALRLDEGVQHVRPVVELGGASLHLRLDAAVVDQQSGASSTVEDVFSGGGPALLDLLALELPRQPVVLRSEGQARANGCKQQRGEEWCAERTAAHLHEERG